MAAVSTDTKTTNENLLSNIGTPPLSGLSFPTPFQEGDYEVGAKPYTRVEQQLMAALASIKNKPRWWEKVNDDNISKKWFNELTTSFAAYLATPVNWRYKKIDGNGVLEPDDVEGRTAIAEVWADFVIMEILRASRNVTTVADNMNSNGTESEGYVARTFVPGPVDGTWMSDDAVKEDLRSALARCIKPLEEPVDIFTGEPVPVDYHPGSNQQVIDLVHPSMYPFVYDLSKVVLSPPSNSNSNDGQKTTEETVTSWRATIGSGEEVPPPPQPPKPRWGAAADFKSHKFQWLPSEVDVIKPKIASPSDKATTCTARFRSYINNLHPSQPATNAELYTLLERLFAEAFVPMFSRVLAEMLQPRNCRQIPHMYENVLYEPYTGDRSDMNAWNAFHRTRLPRVPTCLNAIPPLSSETPPSDIDLRDKRLQVIVKIANIELTPQTSPSYAGGAWHVEGMENESIVASGIYYWHSENIVGGDNSTYDEEDDSSQSAQNDESQKEAPSSNSAETDAPTVLSFRTQVCECRYEQNDNRGVEAVYGLANEESLIQNLGDVDTIQGRCLAWPNTLQHQVQPFRLKDPTKKGYRKIIVFFLVDPSKRVISTVHVPPQQKEWMISELLSRKESPAKIFNSRDLVGEIVDFAWHFPKSKAEQVRQELMDERKYFTDNTMKEHYERPFSLCEH